MELHRVSNGTESGFVLLDQHMRLVQPVNEYLEYQALRGRARNTIKAYVHLESLRIENKKLKALLNQRRLE